MSPEDQGYFRERAQSERERAATAGSVAAALHLELANLYEHAVETGKFDKSFSTQRSGSRR